jgi:hypothetical protein
MTYRPERAAFGPPLRDTWASHAFGLAAVGFSLLIVVAQRMPAGSPLYEALVAGDSRRVMSSSFASLLFFVSGASALLREQLRGVVITPDGVMIRELVAFGMPRVQRFAWSQIDRLFLPSQRGLEVEGRTIRLEMWDGSNLALPTVRKPTELAVLLERVALARAIPIVGGTGLVDDLSSPLDDGTDDA